MNLFKVCLFVFLLPCMALGEGTPDEKASKKLESEREAIPSIVEQTIGNSFRPLVFDWHKQTTLIDLHINQIVEFNNFESRRYGLGFRFPTGLMMFGLEVAKVVTEPTDSTDLVAKTPYRQAGRPSRYEFQLELQVPLADAVVTQRFEVIKPADLVFSGLLRFRGLYYPGASEGMDTAMVIKRWASPLMTGTELKNMEADRLEGMRLDKARYNLLLGVRTDLFFRSGIFWYTDSSFNLPIYFVDPEGLKFWWDFSLGLGYGF